MIKLKFKYFFYIITIIFLVGCSNKFTKTYKNKITNQKMEKLDINKLFAKENSKNESIKSWENLNGEKNIEYILTDNTENTKTTIYGSTTDVFRKTKSYVDTCYKKTCLMNDVTIFNREGNTIKKGTYCTVFILENEINYKSIDDLEQIVSFFTEVGIWSEYNQNGEIIKNTDFDKDFNFNLVDVLEHLKSINVDFKKNNISGRIRIEKDLLNKSWILNYPINDGQNNTVRKILNGTTGEVISEKKARLYNG